MHGSREISLVPSLHRASTDALILIKGRNYYSYIATYCDTTKVSSLQMLKHCLHHNTVLVRETFNLEQSCCIFHIHVSHVIECRVSV